MPTVVEVRTPSYPTVQSIIDSCSQDARKLLGNDLTDANSGGSILLDYVNRISLMVLRIARWTFLEASPQRFITALGQTDYWVGPYQQGPHTSTDTQLSLADFDRIKVDSVRDLSNYRELGRTEEPPARAALSYRDSMSRIERPRLWRNDVDSPFVINLYPAPDNQNNYQPVPDPAICTVVPGGSLSNRTYYIRTTFVDSNGGESSAPTTESKVFVPASNLVKVLAPQPGFSRAASGILYNKYHVYASTTSNSEQKQTGSTPILTTADWTEPTTGLISGVAWPTATTIEPLGGYIIEFRYYRQRLQLISAQQPLQIPIDYKGVIVSGVNMYAAQYLKRPTETAFWQQAFLQGVRDMIRDLNLYDKVIQFIKPDTAAEGFLRFGASSGGVF